MQKEHHVNVIGGSYWKKYGSLTGIIESETNCYAAVRLDEPIKEEDGKQVIRVLKTSLQERKKPKDVENKEENISDIQNSIYKSIAEKASENAVQERNKREEVECQLEIANKEKSIYKSIADKASENLLQERKRREQVENELNQDRSKQKRDERSLQKKHRSLLKKDQVIHNFREKLEKTKVTAKEKEKKLKKELVNQKDIHDSEMESLQIAYESEMKEKLAKQKTSYEVKIQQLETKVGTSNKRKSLSDVSNMETEIHAGIAERPKKRQKRSKEFPLPNNAPEYDLIRKLLIQGGWKLKSQKCHYKYERFCLGKSQTFTCSKTPSCSRTPKNSLATLRKLMGSK